MLALVLLIFAFVCFALTTTPLVSQPSPWHPRLIAAGLAFWSLSEIVGHMGGVSLR